MDMLTDFPPAIRRVIYAVLALIAAVLLVKGQITQDNVQEWLSLAAAVLTLAGGIMAAYKAQRVDFKALYAIAATIAAGLVGVGAITQARSDSVLNILGEVVAFVTFGLATVRTDPRTVTGEPLHEFQAR